MLTTQGEKIYVIVRRRFEEDGRRHFVGTVQQCEGAIVRAEGYAFVFDTSKNQFIKMAGTRTKIFDLVAEGYTVNILTDSVEIKELSYMVTNAGALVCTDNKDFQLSINELGAKR